MRVGILTFHWATNYGAILQAFSLQEYLRSLGHSVLIINYKPSKYDIKLMSIFRKLPHLHSVSHDLLSFQKEKLLEDFRRKRLLLTKRFYSYSELAKGCTNFDVLITGSDQVLNPYYTLYGEDTPTPSYFLTFAEKFQKTVGYAVSFGVEDYPLNASEYAKLWIKSISFLSVRENSGFGVIDSLKDKRTVVLVPDPTVLYGKKLIKDLVSFRNNKTEYYCIYMLRGKKIIPHCEKVIDVSETKKPLSLENWLDCIYYSKGLITNSYHGMIMAILSHVPFLVVLETGLLSGMNDRFTTLLGKLGLMERIIHNTETWVIDIRKDIDWENVDNKMASFQCEGSCFIDSSLA